MELTGKMINEFLQELENDFSNIETVYNKFLATYNPNNIDTTEKMFIDSFDFESVTASNVEIKSLAKLSEYLGQKISKIQWHNIDYFNQYKHTKDFARTLFLTDYKKSEFAEFHNKVEIIKERYFFIYGRLNELEKIELKHDFIYHLTKLCNSQNLPKFKVIIDNLINEISQPIQHETTNKNK
jgi:hypothetical protein